MSKLKIICIILIIQIITMTNITAESPMSENYISEQLGFYSKLSFIIKKQDSKIKLIKKDFDWHGEYIKFYDYSTVENIKENKDGFPELKIWGTDVLFLYGGGRAVIFDRNINWENPSTFLFSDFVEIFFIDSTDPAICLYCGKNSPFTSQISSFKYGLKKSVVALFT